MNTIIFFEKIPRSSSKRKFVANSHGSRESEEFVQEESLSSMPNRYKTMLQSVQSCGDYEKIMQGAYENYLSIKFKDVKMRHVRKTNLIPHQGYKKYPYYHH